MGDIVKNREDFLNESDKWNDPFDEEINDNERLEDVNITLKRYQYELLLKLLEEQAEERSGYGCNDPDEDELNMIPHDERVDFLTKAYDSKYVIEMMEEDGEIYFSNVDFPAGILGIIKGK